MVAVGEVQGSSDTIAAIATPPGRGGVGIVRVSGSQVRGIAESLLGAVPKPRLASYRPFKDHAAQVIDEGIALYFPAPHSFTGEDVLEMQGHGGPVVMDLLLTRVLELGARLARPGEFTERAFLNEKLDLAQAEAVADLIESSTVEAARAAVRSLQGVLSSQVHALVDGLIELRMYVESAIDFPEEEIDFLSEGHIGEHLRGLTESLAVLGAAASQGQILRDGMNVVITGRPNAGKSSLLNLLAGRETAIVTAVPGTTRDVLREYISIDGMPLHVIDTAGLRDSNDVVEREGIRRAWNEMQSADRILMVVDDRCEIGDEERQLRARLPQTAVTVIRNKIDLTGKHAVRREAEWGTEILLSAKTGEGLELLRDHLKTCMGYRRAGEGCFMARRRHLDALQQAGEALRRAHDHLLAGAGELLAEELRLAQNALAEITGEFSSEDLLDRIFASFCIGK
jgi:tRNA modification GTPase